MSLRLIRLLGAALLSLCLLPAGSAADPSGVLVEVALFETSLGAEAVLRESEAFRALAGREVRLLPISGRRAWLRIDAGSAPPGALLVLDRVPLRSLEVWHAPLSVGEAAALRESFVDPPAGEALRSGYVVPLAGVRHVLLAVEPLLPTRMEWRVLDEREALIEARAASNLSAATYAAIFATALVSLALTLAVRQSAYRDFTVFAALWGGFLALAHGHAYELPWIGRLLGLLGPGLLLLVGSLSVAASIAAANGLLGLSTRSAPLARAARWLSAALVAVGVLLALLPALPVSLLSPWWAALTLCVLALPVLAAAWTWRRGARPALAQCLLWLCFWVAAAAQLAATVGWLPGSEGLRALQQIASVFAVLGLSIALTDRVIALRQQAESLQALHESSSAVLRIEQKRREFAEALERDASTAVEPSDLEWRAFRQLLQVLPEVVPVRALALSASGFRGFDYLLAEPMSEKPRICALLAERASTLKGICRARTAMSLPPDVGDPQAPRFAVVPLPVPRPGWGALLLERDSGAQFGSDELELVGEFAALAFKALEQGARAVELRRRAETDPLTGMLNHRAGVEQMDRLLRAARHDGTPLGLLFIDADLLRVVNERFGMAVGDHFLRSLGGVLRPLLRDQDLLFRHGGDEFVLALPGLGLDEAEALGERVRATVASQRFRSEQGPVKITVSVGVAALLPGDESVQRLVERGARAAELAKGQGRNQVARARAFGAAAEAPDSPPIF